MKVVSAGSTTFSVTELKFWLTILSHSDANSVTELAVAELVEAPEIPNNWT